MNRIQAFLVDDEPLALRRLERLLERTERVAVVGCSSDPSAAIEQLTYDCRVGRHARSSPVCAGPSSNYCESRLRARAVFVVFGSHDVTYQ